MSNPLGANRDFRLLWIGGLLAATGAQMSWVALPLLVLRHTGSAVEAGAVGTVSMGAMLITMLPGGSLADLVERRRLMLACDLASALVVSAFAVAVLLHQVPVVLVLLVAGVGAIISSLYGPASFGLLRAAVPAELLSAATSRLQARSAAARLVGPAVGGALFAWHQALPFLAEAAGLSLSAACLLFVRTRSAPQRGKSGALGRGQLTAGISFLWRRPSLRTTLLVFGIGMNSAFTALIFVALAVASHGGRAGFGAGSVVSFSAAGALTGALLAPRIRARDRLRPGVLISATCWACALAAGVLAARHGVLLMGLLVALCTCLSSVASIGFLANLVVSAPHDVTGRVQSAANFLSSLISPLGPLLGGALLAGWGTALTFTTLGSVFAVCAAVTTWAPSMRGSPVTSDQATDRQAHAKRPGAVVAEDT